MAECDGELNLSPFAISRASALLALGVVLAAVTAGFGPVLAMALYQSPARADPYLFQVVRFTLLQASLSAALSVAFAIPFARGLARRRFAGKDVLVNLLGLPLSLPAIVVVLGIVQIYGRQGWFGGVIEVYGLTGILLAHVFFNLPLAARILLGQLAAIPSESFRLGAQLGFRDRDVWTRIEWPQLARALPGVAILIFLLCTASFTVVLTLGGGPRATTLEVAIYQALRFDFDPPRAASLALIQLAICGSLVLLSYGFSPGAVGMPSLGRFASRYDGTSIAARMADGFAIAMALLLLLPPLLGITLPGLANLSIGSDLLPAAGTSLAIGLASALLAVLIVWPLAQLAARSHWWRRLTPLAMLLGLMVPPAVLATGWFIVLARFSTVSVPAAVLVVGMNALMALPFSYTALAPAVAVAAQRYDRLCSSLGLAGYRRMIVVDLAVLRQPLGLAFLMAAIVSLGDLTAIMLFGSQDFATLPSLIYRQMGTYRMASASGTALILTLFTFVLISLANRWSVADDKA
ncbi:MAG: thiamine/thiamine pyrophosphate ABC transporter permease ThiP [Rhizobiales bacterium]|nr:thiamine/thiamine pyrophosphate ABC transporter permease ThiP [Hyphomicrobiales bacterium]MBI3673851.1 thiamine/thiamine pyrophosphate ABC transporter permease ThiP [Hyphomicrobiales bacterium]